MSRAVSKLPADTVYLIMRAVSSLFSEMAFTVSGVYLVLVVGLNPLQLVLVGTVLETAVFLCEVPTGVVADVYSRRLSIIIGIFLIGAGFVLWGAIPLFGTVLLAQALWGVGYTFTSGADAAWVADEVGEDRVPRLYLRGAQAGLLGGLIGTLISVGLASIRLNLPIVLAGGLFMVLGLFLGLVMPEDGFVRVPEERRTSWQKMWRTFTSGTRTVRARPVLITILGIGALYGMSREAFDRLWEVHLLRNFSFPALGQFQLVVWFGIINVGIIILSLVATEVVRRRLETTRYVAVVRMLLVIDGLLIAAVITFGLAHRFALALLAFWAAHVLRNMNAPLYTAWLNRGLDPSVRATVLSMGSQAHALGEIVEGPLLGAVATARSVRTAWWPPERSCRRRWCFTRRRSGGTEKDNTPFVG